MKVILTENQFRTILREFYDPEKIYSRDYIINMLDRGPRELKKYKKILPFIPCLDNEGNESVCTKIPEVVHVYIFGSY